MFVPSVRSNTGNLIRQINDMCDRIDANNPVIEALLPEGNRRERLLKEAEDLIKKYPDADNRPPLFGVLLGVKDIFRADGFLTRAGSALPAELFTGKEAVCVTLLKAAGALILGKTVTTEFAYFEPGPTRNPANINHTPGGSSSGSAAAVAAGFCPLALGTQTIGSIIRPAAFCGVIGFKPGYGRISTEGVIPFSWSADHIGFFTWDIEGTELAASVLCAGWRSMPDVKDQPLPVIGVPVGKYLEQAGADVLKVFRQEVDNLQKKGIEIKPIDLFEDIETINTSHRAMCAAEMAMVHREWFARFENLYKPHTKQMILDGQKISGEYLESAKNGRFILREKLGSIMQKHEIDLWASPSTVTGAPEGLESTGSPLMNLPWTYAGVPAITIPSGVSQNNLPLGLQLTTAFNEDEKLLDFVKKLC